MASLSQMLAANNAAVTATKEFNELLAADFELLNATESLLRAVRDMKSSRVLRRACAQPIIQFSEELHPLMVKYGVELVASEQYVGALDLRVIGSKTPVNTTVGFAPLMTDMDDGTATQCAAVPAAGAGLAQAPQWPFPKEKTIVDAQKMMQEVCGMNYQNYHK